MQDKKKRDKQALDVDILFIFNYMLSIFKTEYIDFLSRKHFTNLPNFDFLLFLFFLHMLNIGLDWFHPQAYGKISSSPRVEFKSSKKNGGQLLVIDGIRFFRNRQRNGKQYWKCSYYYKQKCPSIAIHNEKNDEVKMVHDHSHDIRQNYEQI